RDQQSMGCRPRPIPDRRRVEPNLHHLCSVAAGSRKVSVEVGHDRWIIQKRTCTGALQESAFDPKRTWPGTLGSCFTGARTAPSSLYNHLKAAVDHALPIKGHGVYIRLHARIGHDLPMPSFRRSRDGQTIQEKTTVSSSLRLTAMGNEVSFPLGTSSHQHSTNFKAPCSLNTTAAASACFL